MRKVKKNDSEKMTLEEASEYIGIDKNSLENRIASKDLPDFKVGELYVKDKIDAWLESKRYKK